MEQSDYIPSSIVFPLKENEFKEIFHGANEKKLLKLKRFIAKISEASYRRGVQQALVLNEKNRISDSIKNDLGHYRYSNPLYKSVGLDELITSSESRFDCEYGYAFCDLGFPYLDRHYLNNLSGESEEDIEEQKMRDEYYGDDCNII